MRFFLVQRIERAHQQNHRYVCEQRVVLHELTNFIAIPYRHEHIGQNQVRLHIRQPAHRHFTIPDGDNFHSMFRQRQRHHFLDIAVVVGDQNFRHEESPQLAPGRTTLPIAIFNS